MNSMPTEYPFEYLRAVMNFMQKYKCEYRQMGEHLLQLTSYVAGAVDFLIRVELRILFKSTHIYFL